MYHFRKRHVQTLFIQLLKISNLLSEQNRIEQIFSACVARVKKIVNPEIRSPDIQWIILKADVEIVTFLKKQM